MDNETTVIHGRGINLPDDRSVWVGLHDEEVFIRFMSKGKETRIRLSLEAALAVRNLIINVVAADVTISKWEGEKI